MPELFVYQKNLYHALRTHDVIILNGNIRDRYIYRDPPYFHEVLFDEMLVRLLSPVYGGIRRFDPYLKAAELTLGDGNAFVTTTLEEFGAPGFNATTDAAIARVLSD